MRTRIFLIVFIILSLSSLSIDCKEDSVSPVDDTKPGKREYVWSIDSIDYGKNLSTIQLESIWGSSPTDVWGAWYSSDVRDCLWHFDGTKWSRETEGTPITVSGDGSKNVGVVWGSSKNDVWAFGNKIFSQPSFRGQAFVMHYDGLVWNEVTGTLTSLASEIFDIFANGKDDFWLAAYEYVVHYKSGIWTKYALGDSMLTTKVFGNESSLYALAYKVSAGSDYAAIYKLSNNKFEIVDQTTFNNGKFEVAGMWTINNMIYTIWHNLKSTELTLSGGIKSESWKTELSIMSPGFINRSFYHTSKNIFALGFPNLLYHYNGVDWVNMNISVNNKPAIEGEYSAVWTNGIEVFVCDAQNGIIFHGR